MNQEFKPSNLSFNLDLLYHRIIDYPGNRFLREFFFYSNYNSSPNLKCHQEYIALVLYFCFTSSGYRIGCLACRTIREAKQKLDFGSGCLWDNQELENLASGKIQIFTKEILIKTASIRGAKIQNTAPSGWGFSFEPPTEMGKVFACYSPLFTLGDACPSAGNWYSQSTCPLSLVKRPDFWISSGSNKRSPTGCYDRATVIFRYPWLGIPRSVSSLRTSFPPKGAPFPFNGACISRSNRIYCAPGGLNGGISFFIVPRRWKPRGTTYGGPLLYPARLSELTAGSSLNRNDTMASRRGLGDLDPRPGHKFPPPLFIFACAIFLIQSAGEVNQGREPAAGLPFSVRAVTEAQWSGYCFSPLGGAASAYFFLWGT